MNSLGIWIGVDRNGIIQAAHGVYTDFDEEVAKDFVQDGGLTAFRVGPGVKVRIGDKYEVESDG